MANPSGIAGPDSAPPRMGLAGFAISGAMLPLGVWMALAAGAERAAAGKPQPYATTFYNAVDIGLFALLMAASILLVTRRPDWHRRLTFAAALSLVGPAISRWVLLLPEVFPNTDFAPNILADLFLVALALHDRRESGKVHRATWLTAALMVPLHIISPWIAVGQGWNALALRLLGAV